MNMNKSSEKFWATAMAIALAGWLGISVGGCDRQEGPLEEAGENADEAIEEAGDELEDAGDQLEDRLDRAN